MFLPKLTLIAPPSKTAVSQVSNFCAVEIVYCLPSTPRTRSTSPIWSPLPAPAGRRDLHLRRARRDGEVIGRRGDVGALRVGEVVGAAALSANQVGTVRIVEVLDGRLSPLLAHPTAFTMSTSRPPQPMAPFFMRYLLLSFGDGGSIVQVFALCHGHRWSTSSSRGPPPLCALGISGGG